jgi:hypothetical protein
MSNPKHEGLPVAGYKPQSETAVTIVNVNKMLEETLLRQLDELAKRDDIDKRWLAIGRTQIELGCMAINRAVFQPGRVTLPPVSEEALNGLLKAQA